MRPEKLRNDMFQNVYSSARIISVIKLPAGLAGDLLIRSHYGNAGVGERIILK
jgi:hypothetical protein